mgnify:CR=1 FL=1
MCEFDYGALTAPQPLDLPEPVPEFRLNGSNSLGAGLASAKDEAKKRRSRISSINRVTTGIQGGPESPELVQKVLSIVDHTNAKRFTFFIRYWLLTHEYQRYEALVLAKECIFHHQSAEEDIVQMWRTHFDEGVAWMISYNVLVWYPVLETIAGKEVIDLCRDEVDTITRCAQDIAELLADLHNPELPASAVAEMFELWARVLDQFTKLEESTLLPVLACLEPSQVIDIENTFDKRWYCFYAREEFYASILWCRDAAEGGPDQLLQAWKQTSFLWRIQVNFTKPLVWKAYSKYPFISNFEMTIGENEIQTPSPVDEAPEDDPVFQSLDGGSSRDESEGGSPTFKQTIMPPYLAANQA